jgi:hypothetical protein
LIFEAEKVRGGKSRSGARESLLRKARDEFLNMLEWEIEGA